ncbi:hypothetical protein AMJ57_00280 [Parcubacteria bacterium SG8_24]|nr:MAG: hypothetical protein AMJ57_00280 [Parcubacteria bacterium SG8_24]
MKEFITSDLHLHPGDRSADAVRSLAAYVTAVGRPQDVLIIGGDHAGDDDGIRECLTLFAGFRGRRLAISGNHDVWVPSSGRDSWQRYLDLRSLYRGLGFSPLEDRPVAVGDTAYIGLMGWYDYSFHDPRLGHPAEAYVGKTDPGTGRPVWADSVFVRWNFSDDEMTRFQARRLERHLVLTDGARRRLVVMHHVPTRRLLFRPRCFVPRKWRVANTFLGSDVFAEIIGSRTAIPTAVVCGHIHTGKRVAVGGVDYTSIGSSRYGRELLIRHGDRTERKIFRA